MIDAAVHAWFQAHHVSWVTPLMLAVTWVHANPGLLVLTAGVALLQWQRGHRHWCALQACAVPSAMLLNVAVKHLVQRARPVVAEPLVLIESYAFPSGHAAGSAAFYLCTAAWLLAHLRHRPRLLRWSVAVAAAAMVLWVSLSRLYLGVHYLSDVLAGMLLGSVWVLLCLAAARRFIPPRT